MAIARVRAFSLRVGVEFDAGHGALNVSDPSLERKEDTPIQPECARVVQIQ